MISLIQKVLNAIDGSVLKSAAKISLIRKVLNTIDGSVLKRMILSEINEDCVLWGNVFALRGNEYTRIYEYIYIYIWL